jgi:uncharacterized protein
MILRVSDISDDGLIIEDASLFGSSFSDPSWRLDRVHLRAERDGDDVLVAGEIDSTVPITCGRCLEDFSFPVDASFDVLYLPHAQNVGEGELEVEDDDLTTAYYSEDQIDLAQLVREQFYLAIPMKPLCREDCRGLCPICGGNRNLVTCVCPERAPDPRLGALKDLAARLHHDAP